MSQRAVEPQILGRQDQPQPLPSKTHADAVNPYKNWVAYIDFIIQRDNSQNYSVRITGIEAYPAIEPVTYWHAERHV